MGQPRFRPCGVIDHDFDAGLGDRLRKSHSYVAALRMLLEHPGLRPTIYPLPALDFPLASNLVVRRSGRTALMADALPSLVSLDKR